MDYKPSLGDRIFSKLFQHRVICDADGSPYLIRFFIYKPKNKLDGRIYLHHIVRSDHDRALHSHPWSFVSLMLKGRYFEHRITGASPNGEFITNKTLYNAPSLLRRPCPSIHRLELIGEETCWTLVFIGKKTREWGFWKKVGEWCHHDKYDTKTGLCEE